MEYKHIAKTISDFINHVEQVDPYQEYAGKFDRVIRAVIMAYEHDVRRTESDCERSRLSDLERAYKAYKTSDLDNAIINIYKLIQAYHVLTAYNPCVSYRWAIESIYERDHR